MSRYDGSDPCAIMCFLAACRLLFHCSSLNLCLATISASPASSSSNRPRGILPAREKPDAVVPPQGLEPVEEVQGECDDSLFREASRGEDQDVPEGEAEETDAKKIMRDPGQPTQREWEEHRIDHWPFRSWCPHCVAGKCKSRGHYS